MLVGCGNFNVYTYFDVFAQDLNTMILGQHHTGDLNRSGIKGHLGVIDQVILNWVIAKSGETGLVKKMLRFLYYQIPMNASLILLATSTDNTKS